MCCNSIPRNITASTLHSCGDVGPKWAATVHPWGGDRVSTSTVALLTPAVVGDGVMVGPFSPSSCGVCSALHQSWHPVVIRQLCVVKLVSMVTLEVRFLSLHMLPLVLCDVAFLWRRWQVLPAVTLTVASVVLKLHYRLSVEFEDSPLYTLLLAWLDAILFFANTSKQPFENQYICICQDLSFLEDGCNMI